MADPLIDAQDLADLWRPLTPAESPVADALILVASGLLRRRVADLDARIADGRIDTSVVAYVVTEMVKSAVDATNRPVDAKSVSDTAGPFSRSITYAAASRLAVTDDLLSLLGIELAPNVGSARLARPDCVGPVAWPVWQSLT